MEIKIIPVTLNEIGQLQNIGRATFSETFSSSNSAENMNKYLDEKFSIQKLTAELTETSFFYFAVDEDKVIGYLKLNTGESQTEVKDDQGLEIERIYVLESYHGKKIGQLLFEQAITIAHAKGLNYVWLGVWEENQRAIHFYRKNGFVVFDKHLFILGDEVQTDLMMKKIIV